ncbi:MAG: hypothetical protein LQ338_006819, partial [Usnochroma carphineum]
IFHKTSGHPARSNFLSTLSDTLKAFRSRPASTVSKIHSLQAVSLVAAIVIASPIIDPSGDYNDSTLARRSYHSATVLDACAVASNRETYGTSSGTMIRFKAGMEPVTISYHNTHSKRDDDFTTHVTFGDGNINYGDVGASGPDGMIHKLYDSATKAPATLRKSRTRREQQVIRTYPTLKSAYTPLVSTMD